MNSETRIKEPKADTAAPAGEMIGRDALRHPDDDDEPPPVPVSARPPKPPKNDANEAELPACLAAAP